MDVNQATAREYLFEFIAIELIQAGATTDNHGFDVEVVQCVGNPMEKDPIIGGDFFRLVILSCCALGIAAAQIAGWEDGLDAHVIKHCLSC